MHHKDIHSYLDKLLSPQLFLDNAINGLQIEGRREVRRLAVGVSASLGFLEKAMALGCDALVVHHGLFWQKQPQAILGGLRKRVKIILENEISLFAYHLPLDAHVKLGNNYVAARDMNGLNMRPFGKSGASTIGVMCDFDNMECQAFGRALEHYYGHPAAQAAFGKPHIKTVAFLSGAGWRWLEEAIALGADAFVTGSYDEPAWALAQEGEIHFFALGHFATERVGPKALAQHLKENLSIDVIFIDEDNPF